MRVKTHYTAGSGLLPLREALADRLTAGGFPVELATLGITNGGTEAIYIALQSALQPGSRAAYIEPMSPHVVEMVRFIGAVPIAVPTRPVDNFVPAPDVLADVDAELLLLASPSPVSGTLIPHARLGELIAAARERGMGVILDRSYAPGVYDAIAPFPDAELARQIVTVGSFSSVHGLSGWRVGYYSAPPADVGAFNNLKLSMSICTTAVSQFAARSALLETQDWLDERKRSFAEARDQVLAQLSAAGITAIVPQALPPLLIDARSAGEDTALVARLATENRVRVDAGSRFGGSTAGFLRINLGVAGDELTAGIARIAATIQAANEETGQ